ncbi:hypothetical protein BD779DRAFT_1444601 [Infundibulicybe gibba]|nr:hypothetical protein BD779DRAFT_1444601 [Infundibulicybe gibba]
MYPHQKEDTQYWICLYTTCQIYLDDLAMHGQFTVKEFGSITLMESSTQDHPVVRNLTTLLHAAGKHFGQLAANLIVSDAFRFVSSLILENQAHDSQVHQDAVSFPGFLRSLTGIAMSYVIFAFPHIPVQEYVQVLPEMTHYVESTNDLFSFYKEEVDGEENTYISLLSRIQGCDKIEAMKRLAKLTVDEFRRVKDVLAPEVYDIAYKHLVLGYIIYHETSPKI